MYAVWLIMFWQNGMGTTMTHSESGTDANGGQYTKKCFLWTGASMDVCYTQRDDSATSGSWKVLIECIVGVVEVVL